MVIYIIKWTFIYVILIFLLHNLYLFFQNNLTSTKIKDYYNTYNSYNNESNNTKINTKINTTEIASLVNNLQINSTSLEELNKYTELANPEFANPEFSNQEFSNYNNGLTNDMKSELNDFFNKIKL